MKIDSGPIAFRIFSSSEILPSLQKALDEACRRRKTAFTRQFRHDLITAATEAVANAVKHAGELEKNGFVDCRLKIDSRQVEFRVEDHGPGFVLKKIPVPQFKSLKEKGRGIFMMRQLADSVEYRRSRQKNVLVLKRQLIGAGGDSRDLDLVYEISDAILQTADIRSVYNIILDRVVEFFRVERASLLLFDKNVGRLVVVASRGMTPALVKEVQVPPGEGIAGYVFQHAKPCLIEDIQKNPAGWKQKKQYKSRSFISAPMILSPLRLGAESIGVINVTDRIDGRPFSKKDLRLLTTVANQATAYLHMVSLLKRARHADVMGRELEIARQIQQNFVPADRPSIRGLDVAGWLKTAQSVGGDYYDFIQRGKSPEEEEGLYIAIADVSGHNVAAALTMANFRSQLRTLLRYEEDPGRILTLLNDLLFDDLAKNDQFISMILARISARDRKVEVANAGHRFPVLLCGGKAALAPPFDSGTVLGAAKGEIYRSGPVVFKRHDWMVLYTDGVTETVNPEGVRLGIGRIQQVAEEKKAVSASRMIAALSHAVEDFRGGSPIADDVTLVAVKFE
ncbi:MAG: SpoIIE family protein phosphatase [Deltaproteobacteria bacterium]|nr:SpoIIE family protein phosphatase [Deltaproteobacteria bacterium]